MKHVKSERLKKLEGELHDLQEWLKLDLVPKKDIKKHKEEIVAIQGKIEEEKERLQFLKESGEAEEYVTPKRSQTRTAFTEMPTIPDIDMQDTAVGVNESGFEGDAENTEFESSIIEEREESGEGSTVADGDEESFFSDRNRWRRGGIIDPDADEW